MRPAGGVLPNSAAVLERLVKDFGFMMLRQRVASQTRDDIATAPIESSLPSAKQVKVSREV
jgi:hypothetical protein